MLDVNKREQKIEEEEMEEENEEVEESAEKPKYIPSARDNDEETKTIAKGLFDKMFEIEETFEEEDEIEPTIVRNEDNYLFKTNGEENKVVISPYNEIERYNIEIRDEDGHIIREIPNVKGRFMARMNLIKGSYRIHIKSQSNMPAIIKLN
jgi:hypothetical protein